MPLMWSNLIYDLNTVVTGLRNAVYSLENVTHGITHSRGIYLVYMVSTLTHALRIDVHITMKGVHLAVLLVCLIQHFLAVDYIIAYSKENVKRFHEFFQKNE